MRRPTRRCFGEGSQRPGSERREHRASPPGYWRQHACKRETEATREALSVACTRQPDSREGQAGPVRVAERSVVPTKPGNSGGGKGPQFESDAGRGTGQVETGASLLAPERFGDSREHPMRKRTKTRTTARSSGWENWHAPSTHLRQAAAPVAVSEAQGEVGQIRALPEREAEDRLRPRAPNRADGQLSVGEGMISSESRMLEIGMSGSMSGERRRS